ncbi:MAG: hypothetical protein WBE26_12950 [Phycisphaerae bacterium]
MTVRVGGVRTIDQEKCVDFVFTPGEGAPEALEGQGYTLTIAADTWRVKEITAAKKSQRDSYTIYEAGDHRALFMHPYGFPVDWVIERGDLGQPGAREESLELGPVWKGERSKFKRSIGEPGMDGTIQIRVSLWQALSERTTDDVQQVWDPAQMWWVSFTRWIDGHIDLEATLVKE